ncbi:MAG: NAD-dependent epimerase/dehydratase family protein [Solirubrobacteraceae bacterium]
MPKTFVTGGAGLVGGAVVRLLAHRGDDLRLAVREHTRLDNILDLDYEPALCDILDRRAVRRAMRGVDRVFHIAGTNSLRASAERIDQINVEGTRVVLSEALRAGVERVVYTSSVAAIGPAERGSTADESHPFTAAPHGIPYVNSKREAEIEALRLAAQGLPVVIVNPATVFGRGDLNRSSTELVRRFLRCEIPAYVDGAVNVVDAEDVARGHLLAEQHGRVGERYILGNRNFTLTRLFADLGRLSDVQPPAVKLPLPAALAMAAALERLPGRPVTTTVEIRAASLWWAFRSNKARRELGWKPAHHEDTLESTIAWYREREGSALRAPGTHQPIALRAGGFGLRAAGSMIQRFAS